MERNEPVFCAVNMDLESEVKLVGSDSSEEDFRVCMVCLSTNNISLSIPAWFKSLVATAEMYPELALGACSLCLGTLRRATVMVERARQAQVMLLHLRNNGELNLKHISKMQDNSPLATLAPLASKHLGCDHVDYEFEFDGKTTVMLKKEIEIEVKQEEAIVWSDNDCDLDDDVPIQLLKETKSTKYSTETKRNTTESKKKRKTSIMRKKKISNNKIGTTRNKSELHKNQTILTEAKKLQLETDIKLKEFFEIVKLNTDQQKEELLKRKESSNYQQSVFKCELCYKGFSSTVAYDTHVLSHSDKTGLYKCPVCHLSCSTHSRVGKHVNNHHRYKYTCKICTHVFKYRTAAKLHINWHQGKKYVCDICGQEFEHQNSCLGHKRIKHPSEDHVCNLCGFSFVNQKGLKYHRSRKHPMYDDETTGMAAQVLQEGPRCEQCAITFLNAEAYAAHTRVSPRHGECIRNEPNRPVEPTKKKREAITCEQCGKPQSSLRGYSAHFAKYHPTSTRTVWARDAAPSLCTVCGKTFKHPKNMQFHARMHSDKWSYECEVCHKVFKRKDFLQKHLNIHTNEKRYPCHICGKTFNHAGNRDRHILVHSTKDFKCDRCDKCFKSEKEVEIHVKYVHLKMPYPKRKPKRDNKMFKNRDMYLDD